MLQAVRAKRMEWGLLSGLRNFLSLAMDRHAVLMWVAWIVGGPASVLGGVCFVVYGVVYLFQAFLGGGL